MTCVLDCTFCAALFLPHEKSGAVKDIFKTLDDDNNDVLVPAQWWNEMAELLVTALSRGRLKHADALDIIRLFSLFHFSTEAGFGGEYTGRILDLAGMYHISAADAAYLELAVRKKARLGTLNGQLKAACAKAGISSLL
jgi:predicted nucleic acid-binding protein